jgi:hypothetical protein
MGTGMNTETKLTNASRRGVTSDSRPCHGISASRAAAARLASSMIVTVGLSSIHAFFA